MNAVNLPIYRREIELLFGPLPAMDLTAEAREAAVDSGIKIFELTYDEWIFRLGKETEMWAKPGSEIRREEDHLLSGKSLDRRGEIGELRFEASGRDGRKYKFKLAEVVICLYGGASQWAINGKTAAISRICNDRKCLSHLHIEPISVMLSRRGCFDKRRPTICEHQPTCVITLKQKQILAEYLYQQAMEKCSTFSASPKELNAASKMLSKVAAIKTEIVKHNIIESS